MKCRSTGLPLNEDNILHPLYVVDDQVLVAPDSEDINYMTSKLVKDARCKMRVRGEFE